MVPGYTPAGVDKYFVEHLKQTGEKALNKWTHYFPVYSRELARFKNRPVSFLEIGVFRGGSLPMWKGYFAEGSTLVFIDIDPACKEHEIDGTHIRIGNQADPAFLASLIEEFGPFDVILDDGSHISEHQIASYEYLWPAIKNEGVYLVEDTHTSYWPGFGGGYRNEASFMEYAKRLVDAMHSWYTDEDETFPFDGRAKELCAVRFYDSVVVLEKFLQESIPVCITASDGKVIANQNWHKVRGRRSVFAGKDGTPIED
ncbi:MAG: class I SAM-dependent methyltransferase [Marinovum sp.]|nr:class I SAM-dependent methyltransferase [Marinovum sp.]